MSTTKWESDVLIWYPSKAVQFLSPDSKRLHFEANKGFGNNVIWRGQRLRHCGRAQRFKMTKAHKLKFGCSLSWVTRTTTMTSLNFENALALVVSLSQKRFSRWNEYRTTIVLYQYRTTMQQGWIILGMQTADNPNLAWLRYTPYCLLQLLPAYNLSLFLALFPHTHASPVRKVDPTSWWSNNGASSHRSSPYL